MPDYKQAGRLMQFTSVLGQDELLIDTFEGAEGLSRLFDFQVELMADVGADIDPTKIVGTKATVALALLDVQGTRYFNGLVASFEQTSGGSDFDVYRAHIVPALWQLKLSTNCRVFQNKMPMEIVKDVITPYGLSMSDVTTGSYKPLDYCTQYNETDLNFISRIMEQFGIYYWFEHEDGDHTVTFGDDRGAYSPCELVSEMKYAPESQGTEDLYHSTVNDIRVSSTMITGKHSSWDYDYRNYAHNPNGPVNSAADLGKNALERYHFPSGEGGYVKIVDKQLTTPAHGTTILKAQQDASDANASIFHGASNARTYLSGFTFDLTDHPRDAWNQTYLLTEVAHHVVQSPPYLSDGAANPQPYTNRFAAIESTVMFRPVACTKKPRILGPQTAMVVTPAGEDIFLDKLGRVSVQFLWDRERKADTVDNTWVRVAQHWGGSGWGTYFWPRKHDEVVISFLDGDPDNPIITGSVYNGTNMPKYALPDNSTRSGILTRSSKTGTAANANELRFEDKKGTEEIYINAEKDMNVNVEADHSRNVGVNEMIDVKGARWLTVEKSQTTSVKENITTVIGANSNHTVGGDHLQKYAGNTDINHVGNLTEKVGGDYSIQCSGKHNEKVGSVYVVDAGQEVHMKAGMTVTVEAGMELTLKGAGGFITIGPSGVTIQGIMVLINSGGAAGSGSPAVVTDPKDPVAPVEPPAGSWRA